MASTLFLLCCPFAFTVLPQGSWAAVGRLNRTLLDAIRSVESGGDVCALRDSGRSLGPYLIQRSHYNAAVEVNATLSSNGQEYEDVWGEGSIAYSETVLTAYVNYYATENRLGRKPTDEDFARIHYGGPNGWISSSTLEYWNKVSQAMNAGRTVPMGINSDRCNPQCEPYQCCDSDEDDTYTCFCLQAKVNNREEFIRRPCENCSEIAGIDLVFVLDSSGSIGVANFQKIRNFVNVVINDLEIGPTRTQVGVIVFSDSAILSFNLSSHSTRESLTSAVNQIPYISSGTNTADAIYLLINEGFSEARPNIQGVPRVAIVVTDGKSNDPGRTVTTAKALKRQVPLITTYAVGIGDANTTELNVIASTSNGQNLTRYISSFNLTELERLQQDLKEQTCTASTIIDIEQTPIRRQIQLETKVFLELFIPEDGFTVKVELEVGKIVVCGSNSLERPDCFYRRTYDWKLEVSSYEEVFINSNGFPEGTQTSDNANNNNNMADKNQLPDMTNDTTRQITNKTVYVTIEGLEDNNIFVFNTTYGDTTVKVTGASETPTPTIGSILYVYIIIAVAGGGTIGLLLICLCACCMVWMICCRKKKKANFYPHPYYNLDEAKDGESDAKVT